MEVKEIRELPLLHLYPDLFRRHGANPILTARDWPYPAHTVFNAGEVTYYGTRTAFDDRRVPPQLIETATSSGWECTRSMAPAHRTREWPSFRGGSAGTV